MILLASPLFAVANAQAVAASNARVGIVAGVNWATIRGPDSEDPSNRMGFMGGVMLVSPLGTAVSIQPELLYTMKGAKVESLEDNFTGTVKMNYIEVPVLLRLDLATSGGVRPFVYGGPAIAYKVGCSVELREGTTTINADCDTGPDPADFKSTDFSAVAGAGLAFNMAGRMASIGARYDYGLTKFSESSDVKHRVISIVGTLEFPWKR
jgi:opacity protein-like surface antigen